MKVLDFLKEEREKARQSKELQIQSAVNVIADLLRKKLTPLMIEDFGFEEVTHRADNGGVYASLNGYFKYKHLDMRISLRGTHVGNTLFTKLYLSYKELDGKWAPVHDISRYGDFSINNNSVAEFLEARLSILDKEIDNLTVSESMSSVTYYTSLIKKLEASSIYSDAYKEEMRVKLQELAEKTKEAQEQRDREGAAYREDQKRDQEEYNKSYAAWSEKVVETWEAFIKERFKPWGYRSLTVIPTQISMDIQCEDESITEYVGENLIFHYNVLDGPDKNGYYTEIQSDGRLTKLKINGFIVDEREYYFEDPYRHTSFPVAKAFSCYTPAGSMKSAYFPCWDMPAQKEFTYPP